MAVVGEAHIIVRALTDRVANDIQRGFSGTGAAGRKAGESMGKAFTRGFNNNANANVFTKFAQGIRTMVPEAEGARMAFRNLARTGYVVQTALAQILGAIGSLVGGLVSLGGSALGAGASLASLGTIFASLGLAMISARLALSGVGKALAALNKQSTGGSNAAADAAARAAAAERVADAERNLAQVIEDNRQNLIDANNEVRDSQLELNKAIKDGQEQIQQLGFDAEEAALAEGRAALELDKARETLARTQDLPPNSRARKEAELAFQEAELRLRQAKDRSADLNKEQDRLARTGVAGTQVVISANQRLAQSEANKAKVVRDAARKQADAERELARAREAAATAGTGGGGGIDPFAGLNASQIEFVRNLQTLKTKLEEIKVAVSDALLPNLWIATNTVATGLFDTVKGGLTEVATATGLAAIDFANMVTEGKNVAALDLLFKNSAGIIRELGVTAGAAYGIALSLLNAAAPAAQNFVQFLNTRLLSFDSYLKSDAGAKAVKDFFAKSEAAAAQFGAILGNVFGGIGGIIMANLGPGTGGQIMLDWLETVTGKFRDLKKTGVEGVGSLDQYFVNVAENAKSVLGAVGALIGEIMKLGANTSIKETFDILKGGAPILGDILTASAEAGPVLAELITNILGIAKAFTDTGSLQTFFGTLNTIAGALNDFLNNEVVKSVLDVTGRIFAFGLALGTLGQIGGFAFKIIAGNVAALSAGIGGVLGVMGKLTGGGPFSSMLSGLSDKFKGTGSDKDDFIKNLGLLDGKFDESVPKAGGFAGAIEGLKGSFGKAGEGLKSFGGMIAGGFSSALSGLGGMFSSLGGSLMSFGKLLGGFMMSPAGIVIGIIGLIVGGLILLYNTSEEFRTGMDAIFAQLGATFAEAGQQIMTAIQPLIPMLIGAFQQIMTALAPVIPLLLNAFMQIVQAIMPLIPLLITSLVPAIMQIIQAIIPLVTMLISTLVPVILQVVQAFVPLITMIISSLVPVILTIIEAFVPLITLLINALVPVIVMVANVLATIIPPIVQIVTTIITLLVPVFQFLLEVVVNVITGIINFFVGFVSFIIDLITNYVTFWITVWTSIFQFLSDVWNNIVKFVTDAWNALVGFLQPALDAFFKFWGDIFTNVGNFISDTWNNIVKFFRDGWNTVWTWISTAVKAYVDWWSGIFKAVGTFISDTWNNIVKFFKDGWNTVWTWISNAIKVYQDWWRGIFEGVGKVISDVWNNIVGFFKNGWNAANDWIRGAINGFVGFWKDAFNGIGNFVRDTFNGLIGILKGPINGIIDLLNGMINGLNKIKINVPDWVPLLGGKTISFNVPNIPRLALGGVVSPTAGGTLAQIAEAGRPERVEPLDANGMSKRDKYMVELIKAQGGAGTINITVNPSAGMDESELAAAISREITFQMRRGAVA